MRGLSAEQKRRSSLPLSKLRFATSLVRGRLFVGKRYASKVDDEKRLLSRVASTDKMGIKSPATSIVAAFADMGG